MFGNGRHHQRLSPKVGPNLSPQSSPEFRIQSRVHVLHRPEISRQEIAPMSPDLPDPPTSAALDVIKITSTRW